MTETPIGLIVTDDAPTLTTISLGVILMVEAPTDKVIEVGDEYVAAPMME